METQSIELGDEPRAVFIGMQIEFRRAGHDPVTISLTEYTSGRPRSGSGRPLCCWPMRSGKNSLTTYFGY
jgi:hypothetical protein